MPRYRGLIAVAVLIVATLSCRRDSDATRDTAQLAARSRCVQGAPVLDPGGVGPVRLGARVSEIPEACTVRDTSLTLSEGTPENARVVDLGGHLVIALTGAGADQRITRVIVEGEGVRTERGVGVGSSVGDLRAAHGRICAELGEGVVVVNSSGLPGISFETETDARPLLRGASLNADAIPDRDRITSLWVHEGRSLCGGS